MDWAKFLVQENHGCFYLKDKSEEGFGYGLANRILNESYQLSFWSACSHCSWIFWPLWKSYTKASYLASKSDSRIVFPHLFLSSLLLKTKLCCPRWEIVPFQISSDSRMLFTKTPAKKEPINCKQKHMFFHKTVPDVAITTFHTSLNKDVKRNKKQKLK